MLKKNTFAVLVLAALFAGLTASAQSVFFNTPEDCYAAPDNPSSIYEPHFTTNLGKWQELVSLGKAEEVKGDGQVYCAREQTVDGLQIVRWPSNNPYFKTPDGKLADGRCGNDVAEIWEVPKPAAEPAQAEPLIQLKEFEAIKVAATPEAPAPFHLNELPPEPQPPPREGYDVTIVWQQPGRPFWAYLPVGSCVYDHDRPDAFCVPGLNCVWQFGPGLGLTRHSVGDLVEKGGCAFGIVYGVAAGVKALTGAGGFKHSVPYPGVESPTYVSK